MDSEEAGAEAGVKATITPAMDILVSSNFERLLWYFASESSGGDGIKASEKLKGWMNELKTNGKVDVGAEVLELAKRDFAAQRVGDKEVSPTRLVSYSFFGND